MTKAERIQDKLDRLDGNFRFPASACGSLIPSRTEVQAIVMDALSAMFPGYFCPEKDATLELIVARLAFQISVAHRFSDTGTDSMARESAVRFAESLPEVKRLLLTDIEAIYQGDPAAKYRDEVIICYPGFLAIAVYRMAHILYRERVPLIPRMMTEFAHERTGVDIHPGAEIGEYFFIDHATGIVVGETTVIGSHVKVYQGVTLGAKSFELDADGNPVKDIKRHPEIGNNVVIYSNATILGGNTRIGDGSVIGANTWIIESVPAGSRILYSANIERADQFWGDNGAGI